jgi:hypothetical protein
MTCNGFAMRAMHGFWRAGRVAGATTLPYYDIDKEPLAVLPRGRIRGL